MRSVLSIILALLVGVSSGDAQELSKTIDTMPPLLQALDGGWVMTGDVLGEAVTYDMVAALTLDAAFTEEGGPYGA